VVRLVQSLDRNPALQRLYYDPGVGTRPLGQGPKSTKVSVTNRGSEYHAAGCWYLRKSSIPMPLAEVAALYGPCSKCLPPLPPAASGLFRTAHPWIRTARGTARRGVLRLEERQEGLPE
jgi:hypothetical protein